jgi:hypothetical protein
MLYGVAALSARSAWAVGLSGIGAANKTLILHWNGRTWKRIRSPNPSGNSNLTAVTVTSDRSAWAVGSSYARGAFTTLILRWNGRSWK